MMEREMAEQIVNHVLGDMAVGARDDAEQACVAWLTRLYRLHWIMEVESKITRRNEP